MKVVNQSVGIAFLLLSLILAVRYGLSRRFYRIKSNVQALRELDQKYVKLNLHGSYLSKTDEEIAAEAQLLQIVQDQKIEKMFHYYYQVFTPAKCGKTIVINNAPFQPFDDPVIQHLIIKLMERQYQVHYVHSRGTSKPLLPGEELYDFLRLSDVKDYVTRQLKNKACTCVSFSKYYGNVIVSPPTEPLPFMIEKESQCVSEQVRQFIRNNKKYFEFHGLVLGDSELRRYSRLNFDHYMMQKLGLSIEQYEEYDTKELKSPLVVQFTNDPFYGSYLPAAIKRRVFWCLIGGSAAGCYTASGSTVLERVIFQHIGE